MLGGFRLLVKGTHGQDVVRWDLWQPIPSFATLQAHQPPKTCDTRGRLDFGVVGCGMENGKSRKLPEWE